MKTTIHIIGVKFLKKKKESRTEIEGIRLEVSLEMALMIKKLSKKTGIPKKRGQTVLEWLEILATAQPNIAKDLQELADMYQIIRFSPKIPEKNYLTKFKKITSRII